jgi:hypothetical protein
MRQRVDSTLLPWSAYHRQLIIIELIPLENIWKTSHRYDKTTNRLAPRYPIKASTISDCATASIGPIEKPESLDRGDHETLVPWLSGGSRAINSHKPALSRPVVYFCTICSHFLSTSCLALSLLSLAHSPPISLPGFAGIRPQLLQLQEMPSVATRKVRSRDPRGSSSSSHPVQILLLEHLPWSQRQQSIFLPFLPMGICYVEKGADQLCPRFQLPFVLRTSIDSKICNSM